MGPGIPVFLRPKGAARPISNSRRLGLILSGKGGLLKQGCCYCLVNQEGCRRLARARHSFGKSATGLFELILLSFSNFRI